MAIAVIMDFDDGSLDQYDAIMADMDLGPTLPSGGLFHCIGKQADGLRVVDFWESAEVFGRFAESMIKPITAKHGLSEPAVQMFELGEVMDGPADRPTFLQVLRLPLDEAGFAEAHAKIVPGHVMPEG